MYLKTIDIYNNFSQTVQDAFEMLTLNIHIKNNQRKIQTIALTSCNPKEGKTTLAIGLSISMARAGLKVLLVDADMRKPNSAKRLNGVGETSRCGLTDYLTGAMELSKVLNKTNIVNLTYLACGFKHDNSIFLLCSARFEELLNELKNEYDFIIFDTPAISTVVDGSIIVSKVDATLLVVRVGLTIIKDLQNTRKQLEDLNANVLGVVLNRAKRRHYKRYLTSYNYFSNAKNFKGNTKKK
jgi:capsular exopolysaccharide synthesis family protein